MQPERTAKKMAKLFPLVFLCNGINYHWQSVITTSAFTLFRQWIPCLLEGSLTQSYSVDQHFWTQRGWEAYDDAAGLQEMKEQIIVWLWKKWLQFTEKGALLWHIRMPREFTRSIVTLTIHYHKPRTSMRNLWPLDLFEHSRLWMIMYEVISKRVMTCGWLNPSALLRTDKMAHSQSLVQITILRVWGERERTVCVCVCVCVWCANVQISGLAQ